MITCSLTFLFLFFLSSFRETGVDGSSSLVFEEGNDPKASYKLSTSQQNPGSIKLADLLGNDILELCGNKCTSTKSEESVNGAMGVQEAPEDKVKAIASAKELADSDPPTPVVGIPTASTALMETNRRGLRANRRGKKAKNDGVEKEEPAAAAATATTESATNLKVVDGNLHNKMGAVSFAMGGILSVGGMPQWKMVVEENFPRGGVTKWFDADKMPVTEASTCSRNVDETSDYFLGAFGHAGVSKTFESLPAHEHVRITARVHFLDMWVGDLLSLKAAGGKVRWSKAHWFCTSTPEKSCQPGAIGSGSIDACLDPNFSDTLSVGVDVEFEHVKTSLDVLFEGHLANDVVCSKPEDCSDSGFDCNQGTGTCVNQKATWGIDDVRIYVR